MEHTLHERYDEDEHRLRDTAATELWSVEMFDEVIDVLSPILKATEWKGVPDGAGPHWAARRTAASALTALALRGSRTVALEIRSGYAPEALAGIRRLTEAAGQAERVANDESGQYAANWLEARGQADKPRAAFGADPSFRNSWELVSGLAHAQFDSFARLASTITDDARIVHKIAPKREAVRDSAWLWLTARLLVSVIAGLLKVSPEADQQDFLVVATKVHEAEDRVIADLERLAREKKPSSSER